MASSRLERLCKWRNVYLMMATQGAPPATERWVRDLADKNLLQRVESSALTALLIQKGVFTALEFTAQVEVESELLDEQLQRAFPGFSVTDSGVTMRSPEAQKTMEGWCLPWGTGK